MAASRQAAEEYNAKSVDFFARSGLPWDRAAADPRKQPGLLYFAAPFPLRRNVDGPKEKNPENVGVIRNLLFEVRPSVTGTSHTFEGLVKVRRAGLTRIRDLLSG